MANTRSAKEAIRVTLRRTAYNRPVRSQAKTRIDAAERLIAQKQTTAAAEAVRLAVRTLDKAVNKGVLHKNNAARRKARLMKKLNAIIE